MLAARRFQPQRKAGYLSRLCAKIDTVEILRHDLIERIEIDGLPERRQQLDDTAIFARQKIERSDKKRPGATSGIDNGETAERREIVLPEADLRSFLAGRKDRLAAGTRRYWLAVL